MLSSIHPLGERARHNRWGLTVAAFTAGAALSGAGIGAMLGYSGGVLAGTMIDPAIPLIVIGLAAVIAGALDLSGASPPSPARQVNEHWIGHYRGWVYGGAFGAQLGLGFVTFVVSWTVYASLIAEFMVGSAAGGALVGAVFGFGRSMALLAAGKVRRPSDLTSFHRLMSRLGPPVRRIGSYAAGAAGLATIAGALL